MIEFKHDILKAATATVDIFLMSARNKGKNTGRFKKLQLPLFVEPESYYVLCIHGMKWRLKHNWFSKLFKRQIGWKCKMLHWDECDEETYFVMAKYMTHGKK
jgi:hypothetical protein